MPYYADSERPITENASSKASRYGPRLPPLDCQRPSPSPGGLHKSHNDQLPTGHVPVPPSLTGFNCLLFLTDFVSPAAFFFLPSTHYRGGTLW